jgi:hypothetical protein
VTTGTRTAQARHAARDDPGDYPVDPERAHLDRHAAIKAVVVHQGLSWPSGELCANCHAPWPCRLRRWGAAVLRAVGRTDEDIADLLRRAKAGDVPWA